MRLVLDTDVLVAATRSRSGASLQLVDRALARGFTLLLSVPLVLEYEAVLRREEHRKVHGLTVPQLDEVINSLVRVCRTGANQFFMATFLTDPRDDMVLETSVNGRADLLVTFNQKDFVAAAKGFAHETLRPSAALNQLRGETKR